MFSDWKCEDCKQYFKAPSNMFDDCVICPTCTERHMEYSRKLCEKYKNREEWTIEQDWNGMGKKVYFVHRNDVYKDLFFHKVLAEQYIEQRRGLTDEQWEAKQNWSIIENHKWFKNKVCYQVVRNQHKTVPVYMTKEDAQDFIDKKTGKV